jgi:hypothetical protein
MATELAPFVGGHPDKPVSTVRTDNWWIEPAITFTVFMAFIVYTTWAALQGKHFYASPYLSPYYSPVIFTHGSEVAGTAPLWHSWFGTWPSWWPALLPPSPALFILPFPALFRFTCYYYRKAYYRAFVFSPPGCSVVPAGKGVGKYQGETRILIFQNLHRYAFYFAFIFIFILYFDAFVSFFHHGKFGVGVGTLVLLINATLIAAYTLGCHSFRHLVGGRMDSMSGGKNTFRYKLWKRATWFNERHMRFAWVSLVWVMLTDLYVRLVSMGVIRDLNTWDM